MARQHEQIKLSMRKKITLLYLTLLLAVFSSCEKDNSYSYVVTGSGNSYSVTIQNADNNTQQWSAVSSGWTYKWTQKGKRWLYVSAQNNNSSGNVTVQITKNGKVVATNTSYGAYTIATASGEY